MNKISRILCSLLLGMGVAASSYAQAPSKKLVVYCPHPLVFIEPIVKKFEAATGIQTEVVAAGTGELLKRIEAESANPLNRRSVRKDTPPAEGLMPMASIKLIKGNDEVVNKSKRLWLDKFKDIYTSQ